MENWPILTPSPPLSGKLHYFFFKPSRCYILNIKYIHYLSCQYEIWLYFQNKADIWNYCKFFWTPSRTLFILISIPLLVLVCDELVVISSKQEKGFHSVKTNQLFPPRSIGALISFFPRHSSAERQENQPMPQFILPELKILLNFTTLKLVFKGTSLYMVRDETELACL